MTVLQVMYTMTKFQFLETHDHVVPMYVIMHYRHRRPNVGRVMQCHKPGASDEIDGGYGWDSN